MYSFLQNTLAKNSSPLIFCSQKGFLAARKYFPTWFLFTAHPNTLNFILQLDNWRHTNTLNFTLLYIAPRKYFPTRFPFTQILLTLYYNWTMGPHKYFLLYIALHCSQKILPHWVSFHQLTQIQRRPHKYISLYNWTMAVTRLTRLQPKTPTSCQCIFN